MVMVRKGIPATTARDVASQMGSSAGLIHHYFATMDEVLAAAFSQVAERGLETTAEALERAVDPVAKLGEFFRSYATSERDWAFQLWLDAWADAARRPVLRSASRRLNVAWQRLLSDVIRGGIEHGVLSCPDPDASAWRILSLLDGLTLQSIVHDAPFGRSPVLAWSMALAEREVGLDAGSITLGASPSA